MGDVRKLVVVFASPVSAALQRFAVDLGFHSVLVEPDPTRLEGTPREHGDTFVADLIAAEVDEHTDVVLSDHHRPEIAVAVLAGLIADRNGKPGGFEF